LLGRCGGDKAKVRAPVFKPGVWAAVDLQEHAWLGEAGTAAAVLGRAVFAGSAQTRRAAEAAEARTGEGDAVVFGEDFGEVVIVVVPVDLLDQSQDLVAGGLRDAARRGAASVAMSQTGRAVPAIGGQETAHLPQGELTCACGTVQASLAAA
jgi:hypothetical protein